ncbi:MAG: serine hydroxymethyltransferase [Holosporaceae bacterium]|jgi:glycine hydroxymethyltransferase|nr:serine hydroxymethyltransferase [Holosporaceae bacterium]
MSFAGYFINGTVRDNELFAAVNDELRRQRDQVELIASENFVSEEVLSAIGCVMTNKYAEGYPGKRYYGGCKFVDVAEKLAVERVCRLFGCKFANVQPHSGAQANLSVFYALAKPGDVILGMGLAMGGHLTHGSAPTISGKWFRAVNYGVDEDGFTDYDQVRRLALEHKPKIIVAGASSYSRKIDFGRFREIADSVGAFLMADIAHYAGLIAAGLYPSPVGAAHAITSTTHKTLRGPRGGVILTDDEAIAKKIDGAVFPGVQGGPHMHIIAAKAVAFFEALQPSFKEYARNVLDNSIMMADRLKELGLNIVSGGTDCHMSVVDLTKLSITGKIAETELEEAGITCNKNAIPFDKLPPQQTSGIRIGSAAMTSRGLKTTDFKKIADLIYKVLSGYGKPGHEELKKETRSETLRICGEFPLYGKDRALP